MYVTVFNPGATPVRVGDGGQSLGGGDWGTVQSTADPVQAAIEAGSLVRMDDEASSVEEFDANGAHLTDDARHALRRTARFTERYDQIKDYDKPDLAAVARKMGLTVAPDALRADIEVAIVESTEADIPKPKSRTAAPKSE